MTSTRHSPASSSDSRLTARIVNWLRAPTASKARERGTRLLRLDRTEQNTRFLRWAVTRYASDIELRLLLGMTVCTTNPAEARLHIETVMAMGGHSDLRRLALSARTMWRAGEPELAGDYCDRAEELPWRLNDLDYAPDFMNLAGLVAFVEGEYERAEDLLTLAVGADPDSAEFASDLAEFFSCLDRADEARTVVKAALDRGLDGRQLATVRADLGV